MLEMSGCWQVFSRRIYVLKASEIEILRCLRYLVFSRRIYGVW
jgi:hypothetical protein